jgi:hypothetical protein
MNACQKKGFAKQNTQFSAEAVKNLPGLPAALPSQAGTALSQAGASFPGFFELHS